MYASRLSWSFNRTRHKINASHLQQCRDHNTLRKWSFQRSNEYWTFRISKAKRSTMSFSKVFACGSFLLTEHSPTSTPNRARPQRSSSIKASRDAQDRFTKTRKFAPIAAAGFAIDRGSKQKKSRDLLYMSATRQTELSRRNIVCLGVSQGRSQLRLGVSIV